MQSLIKICNDVQKCVELTRNYICMLYSLPPAWQRQSFVCPAVQKIHFTWAHISFLFLNCSDTIITADWFKARKLAELIACSSNGYDTIAEPITDVNYRRGRIHHQGGAPHLELPACGAVWRYWRRRTRLLPRWGAGPSGVGSGGRNRRLAAAAPS